MNSPLMEILSSPLLLQGSLAGCDYTISAVKCQATASVGLSLRQEVTEKDVRVHLTLANPTEQMVEVHGLSFVYEIAGQDEADVIPPATSGRIWACDEGENHFVCTGFDEKKRRMLMMAVFRAQLDDVREIPTMEGKRAFEAALRLNPAVRESDRAKGRVYRSPAAPLCLAPLSQRTLTVQILAADNADEARTALRKNGLLPDRIYSGVNCSIAPRTDFFDFTPDYEAVHVLADDVCCARVSGGKLISLSHTAGSNEMIRKERGFGDLEIVLSGGEVIATEKLPQYETEAAAYVCSDHGVEIRRSYVLEDGRLKWKLTIANLREEPLTVTDLRMPFEMNSHFDDGESAGKKVLRHSQISQDNSFFLFTPCDGKPPMLLCLPQEGTKYEYFDTVSSDEAGRAYRAYLYAQGAEAVSREAGCRWPQAVSALQLQPGEERSFGLVMQFVNSYDGARDAMVDSGLCDVEAVPGLTVQKGSKVLLRVRSRSKDVQLRAEHEGKTNIRLVSRAGDAWLFEVIFEKLGENRVDVLFDGKLGVVEFFVTLPLRELIALRGGFIAKHQIRDESKWYNGLLAEHNNETSALLSPDAPDKIVGWQVYEFTCDDPGLSKPAFLASKNAEYPVPEEIEALEYYVEHFVWGGLQRTNEEEYPYAIYGIPDWHTLRELRNVNSTELAHLWRAYDYPHIALMYYMLYRIGRKDPSLLKCQSRDTYLERAYRTIIAMYTFPLEIGHTFVGPDGIYGTGFYNELVIPMLIDALNEEGRHEAAARLTGHWKKKANYFVNQCQDLFRSEMTFDTTGFESTQAAVNWARANARHVQAKRSVNTDGCSADDVERFARLQTQCNIACRGYLENAYYLRGSDIRGDSARYTLSYMSQMGGWSLMEEALYGPGNPFKLLRLASAFALSSWALMNAGDKESNYGFWFPGEEHNGAAGGEFEPAPTGHTWLGQPHHRGSWYYSCEIDLGFCGGLRGANTIVADDPDFGCVCYGGKMERTADGFVVLPQDGVQRRFHIVSAKERVHVLVDDARMTRVEKIGDKLILTLDDICPMASLRAFTHSGKLVCDENGVPLENGWAKINGNTLTLCI